jgi:hypothetical protein
MLNVELKIIGGTTINIQRDSDSIRNTINYLKDAKWAECDESETFVNMDQVISFKIYKSE